MKENKFQYVSNAGIVFYVGEKVVGIDCLCTDSTKLYQDTPLQIRKELKPDALIFTHEHEDHFCAEYVKEAWEKNQNLQIYSTKKVIEILRKENVPFDNLHAIGDGDAFDVGTINVNCLPSVHEGDQYAGVQNLTLLIKIEDKHLVITGDAAPTKELFQRIATWSKEVDWLFAPFPYVGLRSTRKLLCENLEVRNIFVLHQPRQEADSQNWIGNTKKVCELAKDGLPMPVFPEKVGHWYCI